MLYRIIILTLAAAVAALQPHPLCQAQDDPPDNPAALCSAAEDAFLQGKTQQAIDAWSRAAQLYARNGEAAGRARALSGLAAAHMKLSNFDEASRIFTEARKLFAQARDLAGEASCVSNLADAAFQRGALDQARDLRNEALKLREKLNDDLGKAIDLVGLGHVLSKKGLRREAVDSFTEALKIFSSFDSQEGMAAATSGMGVEYYRLGAYDLALLCHEESLRIHTSIADDFQQARDLLNIGNVYQAVCDYAGALENYSKAFHIQKQLKDRDGAGRALLNMGVCSKNQGNYAKALQQLREALSIFKEVNNRSGLADCYTNLGVLFKNIGACNKAQTYYLHALRIHEELGDTPNRAADLANLGVLFAARDDHKRALEYFRQAQKVFTQTLNRREAAIARANAAASLALQKKLDEAKEELDGAAVEFEKLNFAIGSGHCKLAAGAIEQDRGNLAQACDLFRQALAIGEAAGDPELASLCRAALARTLAQRGETAKAIDMYSQAIGQIEKMRRNVGTFQLASSFLDKRSEFYHSAMVLLARQAHRNPDAAAAAYHYVEMGRARAFVDMLAEAGIDIREGADPNLLRSEKFCLARMAAINATIVNDMAQGADEARIQALRAKLQDTETAYQRLQIALKQQCPRYAQLYYPDPLTAGQVQQMLGPDTALLEYEVGEDSSFLFALTADALRVYELPAAAEIREAVEDFREIVLSRRSRTYCPAAYRLYKMLVAPAAELIDGKRQLLIIPDDFIHYLAFECLLTEPAEKVDFSRLPYLLRLAVIRYAPSATAFAQIARHDTKSQREKEILICADPDYGIREDEVRLAMRNTLGPESGLVRLPYSALEARHVSSVFPPDSVVLLNRAAASEERIKSLPLAQFKYIDFATHAVLDEERPEFSSIVLAQTSSEEDGFLQMQEIFNLKLNADLVVLSACSTARGRLLKGEGMVGLCRAFFYAGTPSVVASLWNVSDASTSQLMAELFKGLRARGESPAEALRRAKLQLISARKVEPFAVVSDTATPEALEAAGSYSHPFYWASFVLIGR